MRQITLKAARVNAGLTLEEVSEALNLSTYTIIKYERGESVPRLDVFSKLCSLYGVGITDIFMPYQ